MAMAFAELLNQEALALQADGVDIIQFDEPAFNVYMKDAADWGVKALERAAQGLTCTTAVHICYGYGIQANNDWKKTLGEEWRQYEQVFPALAASSIDQVSLECYHSHVPPDLMKLLEGKDVMVGVIDVASDVIETPEQVADTIGRALQFVPRTAVPVHQLRPGADGPRGGAARSCRRWRRAPRWRAIACTVNTARACEGRFRGLAAGGFPNPGGGWRLYIGCH
jgi:methionine synthase II (cobalamin-independent)